MAIIDYAVLDTDGIRMDLMMRPKLEHSCMMGHPSVKRSPSFCWGCGWRW